MRFAPPGAHSTPYLPGDWGILRRGVLGPQKAPAIDHMVSDCPRLPVPGSAEMCTVISQFRVIRAGDFALNPRSLS